MIDFESIGEWMEKHPLNKPFCDDPKCDCHESQLAIGILALYVEDGLLTPQEATRIVEGKALWEV